MKSIFDDLVNKGIDKSLSIHGMLKTISIEIVDIDRQTVDLLMFQEYKDRLQVLKTIMENTIDAYDNELDHQTSQNLQHAINYYKKFKNSLKQGYEAVLLQDLHAEPGQCKLSTLDDIEMKELLSSSISTINSKLRSFQTDKRSANLTVNLVSQN